MTPGRAPEFVQGLMHPLPAPLWGMVNVSISFRTLAMGERVGNAGSDPFRSPMKRCSHARFPPCESHGHALRGGLSAKAVEITHSECLELVTKAFGCESWNVLSAKIEAKQSPAPDRHGHTSVASALLLVLRQDAARGKGVDCRPGNPRRYIEGESPRLWGDIQSEVQETARERANGTR